MPIQTVICPDCAAVLTVDLPIGSRATLEHREGVDLLKIVPRVQPILKHPPQPFQPNGRV